MSNVGLVVATTPEQTVAFLIAMANHKDASWFDPKIPEAPKGYYRLEYPNGGLDPLAPDNFARWKRDGSDFENVTGDCISLQARAGGWSRKQPVRGRHIQGGSINCDFIRRDAGGTKGLGKCFQRIPAPIPGCMVVYGSLPDQDNDGTRDGAGHVAGVIKAPARPFNPNDPTWWAELEIIDCAARTPRLAVQRTTGKAFFGSRKGKAGKVVPKDSWFVVSVMKP